MIAEALSDCKERLGFTSLRLTDNSPSRVEYVGPLGARPRTLKLDLAYDELVENTTTLPIAERYSDQQPRQCLVYTLDEIASEKLRCVIQRVQCRDLYDLHELLVTSRVDIEVIWPLFERKARQRGVNPDLFADRFIVREPEWQRRWESELPEYLIEETPAFEGIRRAVRRELRGRLASARRL